MNSSPSRTGLATRRPKRLTDVRLAVIGCGAIAAQYHLPALARHANSLRQVILVDPDVERARALAATLPGTLVLVTGSSDHLENEIDAAIVATPPWLHHRIAMPLLGRGVDVLCEKPLAESAAEARALIAEAERSGACLCVNQTRRAFPAFRRVRELIAAGAIGECTAIEHVEGARFAWPSASGWHFAASRGARGVLFDQGAHVIDTLCWWLGDTPEVISCATDSFGGPEGVASVVLRSGSCTCTVRLSWLSKLSNTYRVAGTRGTLSGAIFDWRRLTFTSAATRRRLTVGSGRGDYLAFGRSVVDNFLDVVCGRAAPLAPAAAVLPSIELIEECYRRASRLPMPWLETLPAIHLHAG